MEKFNDDYWNEQIIYKFVNSNSKNKIFCAFAHFDKDGIIDAHVVNYIKEIYNNGVDVVFVSTAENMNISEFNKIKDIVSMFILRKNIGYDFGSYRTAIMQCHNIEDYEAIIITNDSIFAPLKPFANLLNTISKNDFDICGMTDNYEVSYHIQSYFILFKKQVISHKLFKKFFNSITVLSNKQDIINNYEIGLSKFYQNLGFKLGAVAEYTKLNKDRNLNSTLYYWDTLIDKYDVPMVKVELLRDNPNNINISNIKDFINKKTNYDYKLIEDYLKEI